MSFKCILDVALFLERFRNIDLYQQGLYCVKFTLNSKQQGKVVYAHPYDCSKAQFLDSNMLHALMPLKIYEADESFTTGVFLIRYTEEEALLREQCVFRLELDPESLDSETTLDCSLLYSELDGDLDPTTLTMRIALTPSIQFKQISTAQLKLYLPQIGLHEFAPVVFDEMHCCMIVASVHCVLLEYMLRGDYNSEKNGSQEDVPTRLAKVLFLDKRGQPKQFIGAGETDQIYRNYVGVLARGHEYLRSLLSKMLENTLSSDDTRLPDPLLLPSMKAPAGHIVGKFSEAVSSHDPVIVATALISEISTIAVQIFHMFHILLRVMKLHPVQFLSPLLEKHTERLRDRFSRSLIREIRRIRELPKSADARAEGEQRVIVEERRKNPNYQRPDPFPIETASMQGELPIIFEETYIAEFPEDMAAVPSPRSQDETTEAVLLPATPRDGGRKHVFVLVHGFQGRSFDVHLLKHAISYSNPDALVLASSINENNTEGDIFDLGAKLAHEVKTYITEWCPGKKLQRLSFIGHSLGGLIIRTALPHLTEFAGKAHLLLTLSTPHLGYMYNSSKVIDAGIWVLKKWKRSVSLQQLSMTDDVHVPSTALYNMSDCAGLRWFRYVVFCSSFQDQYVPHDSARVEVSESGLKDPARGRFYLEMAGKILSQVALERLYRLDVNFKLKGKGIDAWIGRTAHIQFLENEPFLHMLVQLYPEFFGAS